MIKAMMNLVLSKTIPGKEGQKLIYRICLVEFSALSGRHISTSTFQRRLQSGLHAWIATEKSERTISKIDLLGARHTSNGH